MAPHLKDSGTQFVTMPPKVVGPQNLLYVSQREFAICAPHDKTVSIVGTDDCTTCLAVILRHPASGAIALGHFDSVCAEGLSTILNKLQDITIGLGYFDPSPLQLHIVGSFSDSRGYSEELIYSTLHLVHKQPVEIELLTACIGELNTILRGDVHWPIIYGVGVNLKTGEIFPATFPEKGPDIPLRHARLFTGTYALLEVYDCTSGLLRIGPFHYDPMRCASTFLQQPDEFILQHLSSSPEVEPPHVISQIRATLKHINEHPFPEITIFPENRPRYYRMDEHGNWAYCRPETFRSFDHDLHLSHPTN
jgi:protein N-terminal asparagine amidohydrolase